MTPLANSAGDSRHGDIRARQPEEEEGRAIAAVLQVGDEVEVASAGQGCLDAEVLPGFGQFLDPGQEEPAGAKGLRFGGERREARGDQVGVEELSATDEIGQELSGERRLARSVGTGDQVSGGVLGRRHLGSALLFSPNPR